MSLSACEFYSQKFDHYDVVSESQFFSSLKMKNGTFKLTRPSRFRELEDAFCVYIKERADRLREVLDVGVSTGVTTVELKRFLSANGAMVRTTATDLFIDAHIVEVGPHLRVLADPEGWPLQYEFAGMTCRPWIRRLDYVTMAFLPLLLARKLLQPRVGALIAQGHSRPVQMTTRSLRPDDEIVFVENDIMQRSPAFAGRFDLIRAANILNTNYFSTEQIRTAIDNIHSYLRGPGSLVLVARTNESGENAATLLELDERGSFQALAKVGGGSEVEQHLLDYRADAFRGKSHADKYLKQA